MLHMNGNYGYGGQAALDRMDAAAQLPWPA